MKALIHASRLLAQTVPVLISFTVPTLAQEVFIPDPGSERCRSRDLADTYRTVD